MVRWLLVGVLVAFVAGCATNRVNQEVSSGTAAVASPDGRISATVSAGDGRLTYAVTYGDRPLLVPSGLGLMFRGEPAVGPGARLVSVARTKADRTWTNRFGKRRVVRDHYNEMRLRLRQPGYAAREFDVVVRAYDDGVALRYELPKWADAPSPMVLERELTEFAFPADARCWAGSQLNGFQGPQEWEFWPTTLAALPGDRPTGLPLLVKTAGPYVAITEADLLDYAGMWVTNAARPPGAVAPARHTAQTPRPKDVAPTDKPVTLYAHLAPRRDGAGLAKLALPHATPWRVVMVAPEAGGLIESDLVSNLATPAKIDDAWVKPGVMAWDHWWSGDVKMDTATLKSYIRLAHDMGWPYQLIDWQWYGPFNKPESDITHVNPAVDMDEVRRFAKEANVRPWVWLYWTDAEKGYEKAFPLYEKWGIAGVKIDFMDRDDQEMVNWYEKMTRAAADHHLMINFHGAFKPTGLNRTYPNQVTREGILGNEYNRWSKRVTPEHKLTLPFTRFLAGPADFTPGGFLNRQPSQFKANGKEAAVQGTRAAELALFVAYDSPVTCACDRPDHYEGQAGADFLKQVPTTWDETKVLAGEVGEQLVIARRSGKSWYVAAMTNAQPREVGVPTSFLRGGNWRAHVWKDAGDSDINAEHLDVEDRDVKAGDVLTLKLAPAGGAVVRLDRR